MRIEEQPPTTNPTKEADRSERRSLLIERYWNAKDEEDNRFAGQHFLTIMGPTGSGKSTYLQHAMLPYLRRHFSPGNITEWVTLQLLTPGMDPWHNLAKSIVRNSAKGAKKDPNASEKLAEQLAHFDPSDNLETVIQQGLGIGAEKNILIVIDHIEDLSLLQPLRERSQASRASDFKPMDFLRMLTGVTENCQRLFVILGLREGMADDVEGRLRNMPCLSMQQIERRRQKFRETRLGPSSEEIQTLYGEPLSWFTDPESQHLNFYLREYWSRDYMMSAETVQIFRNNPSSTSLSVLTREEVLRHTFEHFATLSASTTFPGTDDNLRNLLLRVSGKTGAEWLLLNRTLENLLGRKKKITTRFKDILLKVLRDIPEKTMANSWLLPVHVRRFQADLDIMPPIDALHQFYHRRMVVQLTEVFFRRLIVCQDKGRWRPRYAYVSDLSDLLGVPAEVTLGLVAKLRAMRILVPDHFGDEVLGDQIVRLVDPLVFSAALEGRYEPANPFELFATEEIRSRSLYELIGNMLHVQKDSVLLHGSLLQTFRDWIGNGEYVLKWWRRERPGEINDVHHGSYGDALALIDQSRIAEEAVERNKRVIASQGRRLRRRTIIRTLILLVFVVTGIAYFIAKEVHFRRRADLIAYFEMSDFTIDCPEGESPCKEKEEFVDMLDLMEQMRNQSKWERWLGFATITEDDIYRQGFHSRFVSALKYFQQQDRDHKTVDRRVVSRSRLLHMDTNVPSQSVLITTRDSIRHATVDRTISLMTNRIGRRTERFKKAYFLNRNEVAALTESGRIYQHSLQDGSTRLLDEGLENVVNLTVGGRNPLQICYQKSNRDSLEIYLWRADAVDKLLNVGVVYMKHMEISPSGNLLVTASDSLFYALDLLGDQSKEFFCAPPKPDRRRYREIAALEVFNDTIIGVGSWLWSPQDSASYAEVWNIKTNTMLGSENWREGFEKITDMEFVPRDAEACSRYSYLVVPAQDDNVVAWYLDDNFEFLASRDTAGHYIERSVAFRDHQKPVQFLERFDRHSIISVSNAEGTIEVLKWPFCVHTALYQVRSAIGRVQGRRNIMEDGLP